MDKKQRKNDILGALGSLEADKLKLVDPLADKLVFLEEKIEDLEAYPFIDVNPNNPAKQKTTPAGKQYKELLQQYINCLKLVVSLMGDVNISEDSPLREWLKKKPI